MIHLLFAQPGEASGLSRKGILPPSTIAEELHHKQYPNSQKAIEDDAECDYINRGVC